MFTTNNYKQLVEVIGENTRKIVQEEVRKNTREIVQEEISKSTRTIVREEISNTARHMVREEISDALGHTLTKAKAYTDDQFNWLAKQMMDSFDLLDKKIHDTSVDQCREMSQGFNSLDKKIDFIKYNYAARIELLEDEKTV